MRSLALFAALALSPMVSYAQSTIIVRPDVQVVVPIVPRRPWPGRVEPVALTAVNVNIEIADQVSASSLELTLTNPSDRPQEARIILPVPDGVTVRSLHYDGVGPEPKAEVLPREEARRIYEAIVNGMKDPALVEFIGMNLIQTSAFPVPARGSQKLRLVYEQVLAADGARVDYVLPRSEALAGSGVAWTIAADIRSKRAIATVYSSSHEVTQERLSATHVRVKMGRDDGGRGSFRLSYLHEGAGKPGLVTSVFAYPSADVGRRGGGYFMLLASPTAAPLTDAERTKREVTVVIDRSGSMRGEKMEQAKAAAVQIVRGLRDGEMFNIIDYSDSIASFADRPVVKGRKSAAEAEAYIAGLTANGGTNIHDSMIEALRGKPTAGMLPIVLFLTDGLPTVGERSETKIREAVKAANTDRRRIFTFGVGFDVNTPLLVNLAAASRAAATFVLPAEDVEVKVSQVFRRLEGPVVTNPRLVEISDREASGRRVRELMPRELPDVFDGDQLVVLGQYVGDKPIELEIDGKYLGVDGVFAATIDPAAASVRHAHIPRLWAGRKVATLVDEIRQAGADGNAPSDGRMKELTDEIVRLSTKFGILTEYTAFLAREETRFSDGWEALRAPATTNLRERALEMREGAAGVGQELDMAAKQAGAPMRPAAGYRTVDRDGRAKDNVAENVQQVAGRTYFRRQNRWVEAELLEHENEKPDRTVEFGTAAYFTLADQLAREGRQGALAQGGEVYLMVGKERVLVMGP